MRTLNRKCPACGTDLDGPSAKGSTVRGPTPVVLINRESGTPEEVQAAQRHFEVYDSRVLVPPGSPVIARYGLLPHYQEMERDLAHLGGARLLNSYAQHRWVADLMDWGGPGGALEGLTPRSWTERWDLLPEGAYVVKGRTNSKKQSWDRKMFARTKADVPRIAALLLEDEAINQQGIVAREYVPLKQLDEGLNGLPITNEWRFFFAVGARRLPLRLTHGFYWQASHPEVADRAVLDREGLECAWNAAFRVAEHVDFFVIDVAEKADGGWIVIEVNDGQMSGLCGASADELYEGLRAMWSGVR